VNSIKERQRNIKVQTKAVETAITTVHSNDLFLVVTRGSGKVKNSPQKNGGVLQIPSEFPFEHIRIYMLEEEINYKAFI